MGSTYMNLNSVLSMRRLLCHHIVCMLSVQRRYILWLLHTKNVLGTIEVGYLTLSVDDCLALKASPTSTP